MATTTPAAILASQIKGLASLTGSDPRELWSQIAQQLDSQVPAISDVVPTRKYTRCQPESAAKDHEIGYQEMDSKGRSHVVVERRAFNGTCKAWKLIKTEVKTDPTNELKISTKADEPSGELDQIMPNIATDSKGRVHTVVSVAKPQQVLDSDGEVASDGESAPSKRKYVMRKPDINPNTLEVDTIQRANDILWIVVEVKTRGDGTRKMWKKIATVDSDNEDAENATVLQTNVEPSVESDDDRPATPKRKYTSSKPDTDPRTLEVGATQEAHGKIWVVSEAKTRGNGTRKLWKVLEAKSPEPYTEQDDVADQILSAAAATPKKARGAPSMKAGLAQVGQCMAGNDGNPYICVVRHRGEEAKPYHVWQRFHQLGPTGLEYMPA